MIPVRVIEAKRDGHPIPVDTLESFLQAFLDGGVPDYQMSAFLMASYFQGLSTEEADALVRRMLGSGAVLDLSWLDGPRVDKHSTGGVGDKVSVALAPLAAELGLYVPMMSGRGLGHTTGTLDKLEAIPGFRTQLSLEEFRRVLGDVGCAMIGQTAEIAPLDRRLYALRDVTGTVPVIPLIAASIMSKKLAEGLTGLVLDVKVGAGAFIPQEERALELARTMVAIGQAHGLPTVALLTAMDRPLGLAVGNGLETAEAVACLRGEGPADLELLVVAEAAEMLVAGYPGMEPDEALRRAREALASGRALERLLRLVAAQGGDPRWIEEPWRFETARERVVVAAEASGVVAGVDPLALGRAVVGLGGGRSRMDEDIDLGVGFRLAVRPGSVVRRGDPLGEVHAASPSRAEAGAAALRAAVAVGDGAAPLRALVSHRVTTAGVSVYPPVG